MHALGSCSCRWQMAGDDGVIAATAAEKCAPSQPLIVGVADAGMGELWDCGATTQPDGVQPAVGHMHRQAKVCQRPAPGRQATDR